MVHILLFWELNKNFRHLSDVFTLNSLVNNCCSCSHTGTDFHPILDNNDTNHFWNVYCVSGLLLSSLRIWTHLTSITTLRSKKYYSHFTHEVTQEKLSSLSKVIQLGSSGARIHTCARQFRCRIHALNHSAAWDSRAFHFEYFQTSAFSNETLGNSDQPSQTTRKVEQTIFKNPIKCITEFTKGKELAGHSLKKAKTRGISHIWVSFYQRDICQFWTS